LEGTSVGHLVQPPCQSRVTYRRWQREYSPAFCGHREVLEKDEGWDVSPALLGPRSAGSSALLRRGEPGHSLRSVCKSSYSRFIHREPKLAIVYLTSCTIANRLASALQVNILNLCSHDREPEATITSVTVNFKPFRQLELVVFPHADMQTTVTW